MRLDLYLSETARYALAQSALLADVRERLNRGETLSALELNGVLHAWQVLIENAIGKAKQTLKSAGEHVPVSAYDAFAALVGRGEISEVNRADWYAIVGLRNRIVHEYMGIDMDRVLALVREGRFELIVEFLLKPVPRGTGGLGS